MPQYQSQIKRALTQAQRELARIGEDIVNSLPILVVLARKTSRPPYVIGNATLIAILSVLTLDPNGSAPVLTDLMIFFPMFMKSLKTLPYNPANDDIRSAQWQHLVECWTVLSGLVLLESAIGRDSLSHLVPLYWVSKMAFFLWMCLPVRQKLPLKAKPNPLRLSVSNNPNIQPPPIPALESIAIVTRQRRLPEAPLSTAEPPSSSGDSITSDTSPVSPSQYTINLRTSANTSRSSISESDSSEYEETDSQESSPGELTMDTARLRQARVHVKSGKNRDDNVGKIGARPAFASPEASSDSPQHINPTILSDLRNVGTIGPRPGDGLNEPARLSFDSDSDGAFDLDDIPIVPDPSIPRTTSQDRTLEKEKEQERVQSMTLDELLLLEGQEDEAEETEIHLLQKDGQVRS